MPSRSDSWVDAVRPIGGDNPLVCIDRLRQEPLPLSPPTLTPAKVHPFGCTQWNLTRSRDLRTYHPRGVAQATRWSVGSFGNKAAAQRGGHSMALDKQALIDGLNSDLAGEYAAIIQYTQYAATVTGPFRESLRTMFMAEVPDEQRHAQYLADQIAFLGGTPTGE